MVHLPISPPFGDQHPLPLEELFPLSLWGSCYVVGALHQTELVRVSGLRGLDKGRGFPLVW